MLRHYIFPLLQSTQVENEYGAFGYGDQPRDKFYMRNLLEKMKSHGITEMFLTSDYVEGTLDWGAVPGGKMAR